MRGYKSEHERKLELFTEWLTTPAEEKLIKTQKEFAESISVDEHTLTRWKTKLAETDTEDEITRFRSHVLKQTMNDISSIFSCSVMADEYLGIWNVVRSLGRVGEKRITGVYTILES